MRVHPQAHNPLPYLHDEIVDRIANKLDAVDVLRLGAVCKQHREVVGPRTALITGMAQTMAHFVTPPPREHYVKPMRYADLAGLYGVLLAGERCSVNTSVAVGYAGSLLGAILDVPLYPLRDWRAHRQARREAAAETAMWRARRDAYYRDALRDF